MTAGAVQGGSLRVGAAQLVGSPGAGLRVLARLYDLDNVLVIDSAYNAYSYAIYERGAEHTPLIDVVDRTPIADVLFSALQTGAGWGKDSLGYTFALLLPAGVTVLAIQERAYRLRVALTSTTATIGKPSFELPLRMS